MPSYIIRIHCLNMLTRGALMHGNTHSHMACTVHNTDSMCLKTFDKPADILKLLGDGLKKVPQLATAYMKLGSGSGI
jgi:hypothetical protein